MSTAAMSGVISEPLPEELDRIFREHYQLVYRTAYGVTGRAEDAEDVLQTLFLRLLQRGSPPDLMKNPKAYLYRAAVNLSLNTVRQRQHDVLTSEMEHFEAAVQTDDSKLLEELHKHLYTAISQLDSDFRAHSRFAVRPQLQRRRNREAIGKVSWGDCCPAFPVARPAPKAHPCSSRRILMNRKRTSELLTRSLGLFNEPSPEEMQSAGDRVHARLRVDSGKSQEGPAVIATSAPVLRKPLRLFVAAVAVGVIAIVAGSVLFWKGTLPRGSDPVTESTWSRVSMDQIEGSYAYHTDGRTGTTLVLPDDSRVEMRVRTELSFEHAADGLRILLKDGSILVSAAKQSTGHLYVQTKDMTVSVVGTVFLVKAEQQGSRVAVIEGEVRVQNGAITEKLLPGEQVATSTLMAARPVIEEIAWSPHAREHFAMLQQSALPPASVAGEARDTFDVVSIRPSVEPTGTGARGGGIAAGPGPCPQMNAFAMALQFDLDPSRLVIRRLPLYHLIGLAYGNSCPAPDSLTGGPDWATTELFDIEATIPAGSPSYTKGQLFSGNAPRLQRMLQSLLADRFKLVLKRQAKEMEGYNIIVALERRLKLSADQTPDQAPGAARGGRGLSGAPTIPLAAAPISRLATNLQQILHRPVVDKTGLTGLYDMWLEFPEIALPTAPPDGTTPSDIRAQGNRINERIQELLQSKLEATTGLKLEPAKVPVEVLEIVSAEKPSQN